MAIEREGGRSYEQRTCQTELVLETLLKEVQAQARQIESCRTAVAEAMVRSSGFQLSAYEPLGTRADRRSVIV